MYNAGQASIRPLLASKIPIQCRSHSSKWPPSTAEHLPSRAAGATDSVTRLHAFGMVFMWDLHSARGRHASGAHSPDHCSRGNIIPIFKKGKKEDPGE